MKPTLRLTTTACDKKSVQEVSKHENTRSATLPELGGAPKSAPDAKPSAPPTAAVFQRESEGLGKSHVSYWRKRLYRNTYTTAGKKHQVKEWNIKIQHLGIRRTFSLRSANKDIAAATARDAYLAVISPAVGQQPRRFSIPT